MAILITQLIDDVQQNVAGVTDAEALRAINRVWGDFLQRSKVDVSVDSLSVTADTSLNYLSSVVKVQHVEYHTDSSTRRTLTPSSIEEWDLRGDPWRATINSDSGTPNEFALEQLTNAGNVVTGIFLRQAPDTTTSAGYPVLKVYGNAYANFTTASTSTIPAWMTDPEFLVNGAAHRLAKERGDAQANDFYTLHKVQRDEQLRAFATMNGKLADAIDFIWFTGDQSV